MTPSSVVDFDSDTSDTEISKPTPNITEKETVITNLTPLNPDKQYYSDNGEDIMEVLSKKVVKPEVNNEPLNSEVPPASSYSDIKRPRSIPKISYTASEKDTLYTIALRFNISPNMLKQINALSSEVIITGQKLFVPLEAAHRGLVNIALQSNQKTERKKTFKRYMMKRITRFDGSVCGTTLLTSNAFMFRADVSDPLVIKHGQKDYNVSIPVDTISEILMFEDFDQMLSNIQLENTLSEEECPKCKPVKSKLHRLSLADPSDYNSDDTEVESVHLNETDIDNEQSNLPHVKILDPNSPDSSTSNSPTEKHHLTDIDNTNLNINYGHNCNSLGHKVGVCGSPQLCQHEFIDHIEDDKKYSCTNRKNPFTVILDDSDGKNKLVLPDFNPSKEIKDYVSDSLDLPVVKPVEEIRLKRVDSDVTLAMKEFFKKIDENTSKMQTDLENSKKRDFPIFISIHAILCARTHGKPSFHKTTEDGHKTHYFWFAITENDTPKIVDNLFKYCIQLKPVEDRSNCLLRCSDTYHTEVKDIILPDVKPAFVRREADTDLLFESFSGNLNYDTSLKVMLTREFMRSIQPYLPCHIIGKSTPLLFFT